jgi:hypothetical protein
MSYNTVSLSLEEDWFSTFPLTIGLSEDVLNGFVNYN